MSSIARLSRSARTALTGTAIAAAAAAALTGAGAAHAAPAAPAHPAGYSVVQSCTGLTGQLSYSPGLTSTARKQTTLLTGTLSGCTGYNGAQAGTGTVTAVLTGTSSATSVVESGTVTVNWPASSGWNPSNGTLTIRESGKGAQISVSGQVTSGAFTSALLSSSLFPTVVTGTGSKAHPITGQSFVNTAPFAASENFG